MDGCKKAEARVYTWLELLDDISFLASEAVDIACINILIIFWYIYIYEWKDFFGIDGSAVIRNSVNLIVCGLKYTATYAQKHTRHWLSMADEGRLCVSLGSSASYYSSSEEEAIAEPEPARAATSAVFSKARAAAPPAAAAAAPMAPTAAPDPAAAAAGGWYSRLTCEYCGQRCWGGRSGLEQHQRSSGRCRWYQREAQKALLPPEPKAAEPKEVEDVVEASPSPPAAKEKRIHRPKAKKDRDAKGKKADKGKKKEKKARRDPTPQVRRKRGRRTPSPSPDEGMAGKQLRFERRDANTFIVRVV